MKPLSPCQAPSAADRTLTFILAGGRGNRLMSLTDAQAKPAVCFGGGFRIVDFTLSNCFHSGFKRMHVLTQYQGESLSEYLRAGWNFLKPDHGEYIDILPARPREGKSYEGTADAVYKNIDILRRNESEWVLILAGDHVYKMDYASLLDTHIRTRADATIPCIEVPRTEASAFGIMHVDNTGRIIDFLEKPADPPGIPGRPHVALASMGIYVFNTKFLIETLEADAKNRDSSHDFGHDIIPAIVPQAKVMAHRFADSCVDDGRGEAYWRDVGTIDAYWAANMDLARPQPAIDMYDPQWPILTASTPRAPTLLAGVTQNITAENSIISGGCLISDAYIGHSMISDGVHVASGAHVRESVLLPGVRVGRNVLLNKAIIGSGCHLPDNLVVGQDAEEDARRFHRTQSGVVLIDRHMLAALEG